MSLDNVDDEKDVDDVEDDSDVSEELLDPVGVREVSDSSARPLATLPTDGLVSTEKETGGRAWMREKRV